MKILFQFFAITLFFLQTGNALGDEKSNASRYVAYIQGASLIPQQRTKTLDGRAGDDVFTICINTNRTVELIGGPDKDTFGFRFCKKENEQGYSNNIILDFHKGEDVIKLTGFSMNFDDVIKNSFDRGDAVIIFLDDMNIIRLPSMTVDELDENDFVFEAALSPSLQQKYSRMRSGEVCVENPRTNHQWCTSGSADTVELEKLSKQMKDK